MNERQEVKVGGVFMFAGFLCAFFKLHINSCN